MLGTTSETVRNSTYVPMSKEGVHWGEGSGRGVLTDSSFETIKLTPCLRSGSAGSPLKQEPVTLLTYLRKTVHP